MSIGVYAIVDVKPEQTADDVEAFCAELVLGGVRTVQLRAKTIADRDFLALAERCVQKVRALGADFYINDRADVAVLSCASGLHVGQKDLAVRELAKWLPAEMKLGLSCHTIEEIERAQELDRLSYVAFGPVFETKSKAEADPVVGLDDLFTACQKSTRFPVVAIGGIGIETLASVQKAGASGAAMISAFSGASSSVRDRALECAKRWRESSSP